MASTSSVSSAQKASNHDELFMQQSLIFSDTLKDLKSLRKQLYSAAEFFEVSYIKQDQKQIVVETSKDYAIKALINTVDHLGSVAYKINSLLDEKIGEVSETELRFTSLEKKFTRIRAVEETEDDLDRTTSNHHSSSLIAEEDLHQFQSENCILHSNRHYLLGDKETFPSQGFQTTEDTRDRQPLQITFRSYVLDLFLKDLPLLAILMPNVSTHPSLGDQFLCLLILKEIGVKISSNIPAKAKVFLRPCSA
ncbi:hypothetical protein JRO89_XS13G0134200 [Xanthoceras sorbifolium]|uniref:Protein ABIL2 n=1 Tax=Xanthoceras sorbifolium TaxID=99658 RepID=A0ABQ8H867_9ROSI|nr:hypothetical protein JRO89_XS13G0134200 [Xanthoceras sorbifolium]